MRPFFTNLMRDVLIAFRQIWKQPGFALNKALSHTLAKAEWFGSAKVFLRMEQ
jgi:hypothetical protein